MPTLTNQVITETGLELVPVAADVGGDEIEFDQQERTFLFIDNADASPMTVTITAFNTTVNVPGFGDTDRGDMVVIVTNAEKRYIGPFPKAFSDPANGGRIQVTYTAVTSVTVAALKMPAS